MSFKGTEMDTDFFKERYGENIEIVTAVNKDIHELTGDYIHNLKNLLTVISDLCSYNENSSETELNKYTTLLISLAVTQIVNLIINLIPSFIREEVLADIGKMVDMAEKAHKKYSV